MPGENTEDNKLGVENLILFPGNRCIDQLIDASFSLGG